ncbi:sensor histidine kinase, partial [Bacteroides intestinalis]|uniref:sensor histidine kinase n=1 Tax=Bacteroides intestinalis TaxID=329854 RepID=UPI000B307DD6
MSEAVHRKQQLNATTDTLLLPAIKYFSQSGDSLYAERALYCKAHLDRRLNRMSDAMQSFLKALNNMTHEFKTPISTISLAAQMLKDPAVGKSPAMFQHISTVINDETKRLRFQVEKVLQMSMFDKQKATLKMKELDANELITGVINTFTLKVERYNGNIESELNATDPDIFADEMHLTNVIFNLMDNAVKYKRPDADLELKVKTWNEPGKLMISIQDNG